MKNILSTSARDWFAFAVLAAYVYLAHAQLDTMLSSAVVAVIAFYYGAQNQKTLTQQSTDDAK